MTRRTTLWLCAALLGIVASAAVAWTASQFAGQRIGLSSAPPSVVHGLAPEQSAGAMRSLRRLQTARPFASRRFSRSSHPLAPQPQGDDSGGSRGQESAGPDD
jgi:hypothetical protein